MSHLIHITWNAFKRVQSLSSRTFGFSWLYFLEHKNLAVFEEWGQVNNSGFHFTTMRIFPTSVLTSEWICIKLPLVHSYKCFWVRALHCLASSHALAALPHDRADAFSRGHVLFRTGLQRLQEGGRGKPAQPHFPYVIITMDTVKIHKMDFLWQVHLLKNSTHIVVFFQR